ncbi:MAG: purine-nucleoside phosphorylase [Sphingobacteriales bacterium]|jgi:purine-nucleoside phosphorylase|nr:purine-nucleoside phosphorylase [Sphingobacteriales bacterium]MBP9141584.1 purine-nucleoside phosphorylase [Chitinophagales bacterium]MDA0198448.1 purine-nucleoside phosphorylase [Bacteroidota bacterium]MBK6890817.1 purine-nucleoside phosphorylase [Sphingobacteriales bacterium]MBK7526129.1 purine-nucleoside phosphorylase [Sphingobacteriales bacterium]
MSHLPTLIEETAQYLITQTNNWQPRFAIILGTGLGGLVQQVKIEYSIDYAQIPHFPVSTVESHHGRLVFGWLGGHKVAVMQGRFHYYEGYSMQQVTFPVRVFKRLGIEKLFISNVSGSVCEDLDIGDFMILTDHINLQPENPLRGVNYPELGPRFPDFSQPYDQTLINRALSIAQQQGIPCKTGVYASVSGPNIETKAEYIWLNRIGANAVGMSTVPEAIVAVHTGLPIFAVSIITDVGYPPHRVKSLSLEDVVAVAAQAESKLCILMEQLIAQEEPI